MTRRCSHCSNNGHNSRTCPTRAGGGGSGGHTSGGVRLFGVRLTDGSIIKKSASMGNLSSLSHYHSSSSAAPSPNPGSPASDHHRDHLHLPDGYLSDDPNHASCSSNRRSDRKKGIPWTEEEHRLFLLGLQKLGKGDWRGISRSYVISRTPTQVASHAQKYFIRQNNATRRKRRSSLFDMVADTAADQPSLQEEQFMLPPQAVDPDKEHPVISLSEAVETDNTSSLSLALSLRPECEPMEATPSEAIEETKKTVTPLHEIPPVVSSFFPAYLPLPFPLWPAGVAPLVEEQGAEDTSHHEVLRPIPIVPKEPVNVDELVGMSQLSLGEIGKDQKEPLSLSLNLPGETPRQSAFHASNPANGVEFHKGKDSLIQTV